MTKFKDSILILPELECAEKNIRALKQVILTIFDYIDESLFTYVLEKWTTVGETINTVVPQLAIDIVYRIQDSTNSFNNKRLTELSGQFQKDLQERCNKRLRRTDRKVTIITYPNYMLTIRAAISIRIIIEPKESKQ